MPQLGAALAYFTVFSLAPLVVVLLAVFGLIFGSSEMARDRITNQLHTSLNRAESRFSERSPPKRQSPRQGL
jgi:membrane protein